MGQRAARRSASNPSIHLANQGLSAPMPIVADRLILATREYFSVSAIQSAFLHRRAFESQPAPRRVSDAELSFASRSATLRLVLPGIPEPLPRLDWNSESRIEQLKSEPALLSA